MYYENVLRKHILYHMAIYLWSNYNPGNINFYIGFYENKQY